MDIQSIRDQFPILKETVNGAPLVYFDNAATTQKPQVVIDAISNYYQETNANIHRGIHSLSEKATTAFEDTRDTLKVFINAEHREEVIITKGTTDSINLVAHSLGTHILNAGDEIIISGMEHHSNIVPWQLIANQTGAVVKVIPVLDNGTIDLETFKSLLTSKTKIVSVVHASNSLGTINPIKQLVQLSHAVGAKIMIDCAQSASHINIDVQDLNVDFLALSGHKMYGPTGVGVLYGKKEILETIPPYQGGGEMIKEVSFEKTTYADLPYKFEAGTPNIGNVVALKSAVDFVSAIGRETIAKHEEQLLLLATEKAKSIKGLRIIGEAPEKVGVLSFVFDDVHHQDLAILLDQRGIAIRTGHHCTQPLMARFDILGTSRISFAIYNTEKEVIFFFEKLEEVLKMLR